MNNFIFRGRPDGIASFGLIYFLELCRSKTNIHFHCTVIKQKTCTDFQVNKQCSARIVESCWVESLVFVVGSGRKSFLTAGSRHLGAFYWAPTRRWDVVLLYNPSLRVIKVVCWLFQLIKVTNINTHEISNWLHFIQVHNIRLVLIDYIV